MKAEILVGIPASGKTDYAEKKCLADGNWVNINRDDIRFSITGAEGWKNYKFNHTIENMITNIQKHMVDLAADQMKNIIISDTNLNPSTREGWHKKLAKAGVYLERKYEVVEVPFPITLEEAYRRDALRPNGCGRDVIYDMYQKWLVYTGRKVYTPDPHNSKAIIFDIDGTLAIMGDRSPYAWDEVGIDETNIIVTHMLRGYYDMGYCIVLVSGRDSVCRNLTEEWLIKHSIHYTELFMRDKDDQRKDTIVKEEIFWRDIVPLYNVNAVVDDRPSVCRMWRELGLPVIQVGDPYKEF